MPRGKIKGFGVVLLALSVPGCKSEATKKCHELMTSAQGIVTNVDSKDLSSVETSLGAVQNALAACQAAGRNGEVDELTKAKNQFQGHLDYLKKRAAEPKGRKRTPEELAEIAKQGDPECPKGQAYRDATLGKEIRCMGPQPADMGWKKAQDYYTGRGYKMSSEPSPPTLKAEYGAELLVYTYARQEDTDPPRCLAVYPPPGESWQEALSKVTGVAPKKFDKATTVHLDRGTLPFSVVDTESKMIVKVGDCG